MPDDADQQTEPEFLQPDTLMEKARAVQVHGLQTGALKPIPALPETVIDEGIPFTVWRLERPDTQLPADRERSEKPAWSEADANPFLPYDPALYVSGITETHDCLLNKYNILDVHLLIVTRSFEHQTKWLTLADFEALRLCMVEFDGLAFYNGGKAAGASQRHKHLQYVPLPLAPGESGLPIAPAVAAARWVDGIGTVASFPFVHALGRLDTGAPVSAEQMLELYWRLLSAVGVQQGSGSRQTRPYNLLATREWMMVVPRSRESWAGISVNALGFAGSLLVRNHEQMRGVRDTGPLTVLKQVGFPRELVS